MVKTIKNQKNLFFFIKLILFCGVLGILLYQIQRIDKVDWQAFHLENGGTFILAMLLVVPNIWFAYIKWTLTLRALGIRAAHKRKVESFFAGIVTGMLTPNMLGNFIGRFYYFDRKHRVDITLFTLLSNFAQFIASVSFGWLSVVLLDGIIGLEISKNSILLIGVVVVISYLCYFYGENFLMRVRKKEYVHRLKNTLKTQRTYRPLLLSASIARFLIFTTQFGLMLHAFGESLSIQMVLGIWQVYLITMLIPSLFFGKIGIKESVAIFVLGALGMNSYSVLFASLCIWTLNSLFPALVGLIICSNRRDE